MLSPRVPGLLWAMPLAWASSALILLGHSARKAGQGEMGNACDLLLVLIFCGCLRLAWKCFDSAQNRLRARRAIALLIVFAVPIQGFAGVAMEVRGPAHLHAGEPAAAHHWHGDVEHHHHAADANVVEVDDDGDHGHAALSAGENKRVAPGALDTPVTAALVFPACFGAGAIPARHGARLAAYFPGMPERPPRASSSISS